MSSISFVYFDLGNVILNFSHQRMVNQVAAVSGLDAAQVQKHMFDNRLEDRYETGELNSQQFHAEFCAATGLAPRACTLEEFLSACGDIFWLNAPTVPVISQLARLDIGLGILSNTCQAHWDFVQGKFGVVNHFFPTIVTSFDAKSMKPDAGIYQVAIKKAKIDADRIFFTDDKIENIEAARAAGMHAKPFTSAGQLMRDLIAAGVPIA